MWLTCLALAVILGGVGCAPAARNPASPAAPSLAVRVEERFYPVAGQNARTLNRALATQGPRTPGRIAHALTEWRVAWSYVPAPATSGCRSARPSVVVDIVTTLPRWVDLPTASERMVSDWALFLARLRDHEARHQHLAVESSRELLARLNTLRAPDCELLEEAVQHAAREVRVLYDARHQDIDQTSRYGLRETP